MIQYFSTFNTIDSKQLMAVYTGSNEKGAQRTYPEEKDYKKRLDTYESAFIEFIRDDFLSLPHSTYAVYVENGIYFSAARLIRSNQNIVYLEALETNPLYRKQGYAKKLIMQLKIDLIRQGVRELRSNVSYSNEKSLSLHKACGFIIDQNPGYDYHYGAFEEGSYGMLCLLPVLNHI